MYTFVENSSQRGPLTANDAERAFTGLSKIMRFCDNYMADHARTIIQILDRVPTHQARLDGCLDEQQEKDFKNAIHGLRDLNHIFEEATLSMLERPSDHLWVRRWRMLASAQLVDTVVDEFIFSGFAVAGGSEGPKARRTFNKMAGLIYSLLKSAATEFVADAEATEAKEVKEDAERSPKAS